VTRSEGGESVSERSFDMPALRLQSALETAAKTAPAAERRGGDLPISAQKPRGQMSFSEMDVETEKVPLMAYVRLADAPMLRGSGDGGERW